MPIFEIENKAARAVKSGSRQVIPFAQVIRLNVPGNKNGGLIWNRPVSILVREEDGQDLVIPILDITRQVQIFLIGLGLFGAFLIWIANRSQISEKSEEIHE